MSHHDRLHADIEGDFVVFLVGMRINRFRAVREWLPIIRAAPRMVREQRRCSAHEARGRSAPGRDSRPDGLLGSRFLLESPRALTIVQYWRSFEALREYARADRTTHRAWWQRFNRQASDSDAVGIWHETYLVRAGEYESVYRHMPEHGLGAATGSDLVPATGVRETAAGRLGRTDGDDAPLTAAGGSR